MIGPYFSGIRELIASFRHIVQSSSLSEKHYSEMKGYISGTLVFIDGSTLEFTEVKSVARTGKEKYSYHFMDSDNQLIFRYDNAPHFRQLSTFPNHLHLPEGVLESVEPDFETVLLRIERTVLRKY